MFLEQIYIFYLKIEFIITVFYHVEVNLVIRTMSLHEQVSFTFDKREALCILV